MIRMTYIAISLQVKSLKRAILFVKGMRAHNDEFKANIISVQATCDIIPTWL